MSVIFYSFEDVMEGGGEDVQEALETIDVATILATLTEAGVVGRAELIDRIHESFFLSFDPNEHQIVATGTIRNYLVPLRRFYAGLNIPVGIFLGPDHLTDRNLIIFKIQIYNAYRVENINRLLSNGARLITPTPQNARNFEFKLQCSKTVKALEVATTAQADVTNNIVCICAELLEGSERTSFLRSTQRNPQRHCISLLCPFGVILKYHTAIPDPSNEGGKHGLKYIRALSSTGHPRSFCLSNFGENGIRKVMGYYNEKLPKELRMLVDKIILYH